jgi:DNA-binding MarR family transcriptional regulator
MKLGEQFKRHLEDTLGIPVKLGNWGDAKRLPLFLRDTYTFFRVLLLETPCLLMVARDEAEQTPATVRKHIEQIQEKWEHEVIYIHPSISSHNRKRLIEQKVPFVVPGNQMYLPLLGIDLREHFRKIRSISPMFSPSTQTLVIHALLLGIEPSYTPSGVANRLGYTVMTLTRAFDELEAVGLGEVSPEGRERVLRFGETKKALWEKALPFMRNPVTRRTFINKPQKSNWKGLMAGISALSHYSILAPPSIPVYAINLEKMKELKQRGEFKEMALPIDPGVLEVQIWSYAPHLFSNNGIVDPFSLYLSLRENEDERVQAALEEMMENIKW